MMTTTQVSLADASTELTIMREAEKFLHDNPTATYQQVMQSVGPLFDRLHDFGPWIVDWIVWCVELAHAGLLEKTLGHLNPHLQKPAQPCLITT